MINAILFGKPKGETYTMIKFNKPLSELLTFQLQIKVNEIKKKECKDDVVILNTNLEELGINV